MKETAVIIANWNGKEYLENCLSALRNQTYKDFKTMLVDNGSSDESVFFVEKNYPEVELIKLDKNTGFAYANNLGIQKALADESIRYLITLNNDTRADENYLEKLVECAKNHPEAGSIQSKVLNFFEKSIIDSTGILIYPDMSAINRGQKEKDERQFEKEEEIFGASASAALYAREMLEKVKLPGENYFDSDYFAYYEDVDLAWRLRLAGFSSFYCPKAVVYHVHSATGKNYSPFKSFHIHRNQYYNILKDLPFCFMLKALAFMPIRYCMLLASVLRRKGPAAKLTKNTKEEGIVRIVLRSWKQIIKNLPMLMRKRKFIQKNKAVKNSEIKKWLELYQADFKKMIFQ
ncbi:MAG: glycosyltransferase family 2 protein [Parcubacteria group bacterium]